jgi:hypothetical protein
MQAQSADFPAPFSYPSGTNRDAVKYKNELDAKTHYLTKKLQEQANEVQPKHSAQLNSTPATAISIDVLISTQLCPLTDGEAAVPNA